MQLRSSDPKRICRRFQPCILEITRNPHRSPTYRESRNSPSTHPYEAYQHQQLRIKATQNLGCPNSLDAGQIGRLFCHVLLLTWYKEKHHLWKSCANKVNSHPEKRIICRIIYIFSFSPMMCIWCSIGLIYIMETWLSFICMFPPFHLNSPRNSQLWRTFRHPQTFPKSPERLQNVGTWATNYMLAEIAR